MSSHLALCLCSLLAAADPIDQKYPLDAPLRVLAVDVESPDYRELVTRKMLITDLAAEWQRMATADNAESFLEKHGGKDKVFADADLKRAYERRVVIRTKFVELMREGYKRYKAVPPFDKGEKAETSATIVRPPAGTGAALAPVLPAPGSETQWPRFRGPTGQGHTTASSLPVSWNKRGENIRWRVKVPTTGNSSPVVWGDRLFLTGASEDGRERWLYCFSVTDGRLLWSQQAPAKPPETGVRDKNGYASATPITDGERVVAFFGSCGLVCWDFAGKLLWHYDQLKIQTTHGAASSPIFYKDLVLFLHDQNRAEPVFVALDKKTGEVVWKHTRLRAMTWCTPVVVRVGDHDELVFAGGETVKGYDPATGKELWTLKGPTVEVVPTIVVGKDVIYSASGRNGPIIALRPGGKGDVSETHLVWRTVRGGPHVPSPILVNGRLFSANDTGILSCLDAATGKLIWQERLYAPFSASPVEAGGLIYFPSETGVTYVVKAADQFEVVAQNDLGSAILASPAVVGNRLILRTREELVCIGQ